jgi:hypothetical protein
VSRIIGPPPAPGATKRDRLFYARRFYFLGLPTTAVCWTAVALLDIPGWTWPVMGVFELIWLSGFATLTRQIRREPPNP